MRMLINYFFLSLGWRSYKVFINILYYVVIICGIVFSTVSFCASMLTVYRSIVNMHVQGLPKLPFPLQSRKCSKYFEKVFNHFERDFFFEKKKKKCAQDHRMGNVKISNRKDDFLTHSLKGLFKKNCFVLPWLVKKILLRIWKYWN